MLNEESCMWMSVASTHRDTRDAACAMAGRLATTRFDDAMLLYGIAYCMDAVNGETLNTYAFGWARYTACRILYYAVSERTI